MANGKWLSAMALAAMTICAPVTAGTQYAVTRTLHVGGEGGWDYVTIDHSSGLLFLTRSTHTIVIDVESGKIVADIPGGKREHGVALDAATGRGFITDGNADSVIIFDLKTYEVIGSVSAAKDADAILYEPTSKNLLIACGDAEQLTLIPANVDPKSPKGVEHVDLGGKPEAMVVDGKGSLFVCLEDKNEIAQVDLASRKVVQRYATKPAGSPVGLALDPATHMLFVGCRSGKMLAMSATDGAIKGEFPIGKGVDGVAFYKDTAFASCGDGTLTIVGASGDGKLALLQTLKTAPNARTCAADPESGTIYLVTADLEKPEPAAPGEKPKRPKPVAGSFRVLVVEPAKVDRK